MRRLSGAPIAGARAAASLLAALLLAARPAAAQGDYTHSYQGERIFSAGVRGGTLDASCESGESAQCMAAAPGAEAFAGLNMGTFGSSRLGIVLELGAGYYRGDDVSALLPFFVGGGLQLRLVRGLFVQALAQLGQVNYRIAGKDEVPVDPAFYGARLGAGYLVPIPQVTRPHEYALLVSVDHRLLAKEALATSSFRADERDFDLGDVGLRGTTISLGITVSMFGR